MRALSIGATGMQAQQLNVEVISNNIANISTTGFKRTRAEFQDMLYENLRRVGSPSSDTGTLLPSGLQVGLGVKPVATYRIHEQGNLTVTNNQYDVAINGRGFLQVQMPDGTTAYTRAGSLQLNETGQLVTPDGFLVLPTITVPTNALSVTINPSGQVSATIDGQTGEQSLGQLQLAAFINPVGLEAIGDNLLKETAASGSPITGNPQSAGFGSLIQGSVESSNVNVVSEITGLITAQRAYEMNSRVIKTADDMLTTVSQLR
ncbi:MAG: flagellar basal-body rod protein FlgG [Alphaproteobacteria bacterium]|jgi:flagellar basal-body rod protein FlgG|nr:flagellar basal-body rod protein FlgG [Alphaproteobacteria bacterium]